MPDQTRRDGNPWLRVEIKLRLIEWRLSPREREVVCLLAKGLTNKEIAQRCHVCEQTVKDHLKHVYEKVHVHNRVQLFGKLIGFPVL